MDVRLGVRDACEVVQQRRDPGELGGRGTVEVDAQLGQVGQRVQRHAVVAAAATEQVGDARAVRVEPRQRHAAPAAAVERDELDAGLPRAQRGADRSGAPAADDAHVEPRAVDRDVDGELDDRPVGRGGVVVQPRAEPVLDRVGVLAVELDAAAGHQVELVAQAVDEPLLGVEVAHRQRAVQMDELATVDAGARRRAVDEQRQHRELVAVLDDVELHARALAAADRRQPHGAHLDRQSRAERRQRARQQLGQRAARHVVARRQLLHARATEVDGTDRSQHVGVRAHDAERDDLRDLGVGDEGDARAAVGSVVDDDARHDGLAIGLDLQVPPAHVTRIGEQAEQAVESVS